MSLSLKKFMPLLAIGAALGVSFHSPEARAGGTSGGGGAVAVCRDVTGKVTFAQMLDLYEGRVRFGLAIDESTDDPNAQLAAVVERLKPWPFQHALVTEQLVDIVSRWQFLPPGVSFQAGVDLGSEYGVVVPDGCHIEYVGFYETDGTLKVPRSVYRALSVTDRAAFLLHEAIYRIARDTSGDSNAALSRRLVAEAFARAGRADVLEELTSKLFYNYEELTDGARRIEVALPEDASDRISVEISPLAGADVQYSYAAYCQGLRGWDGTQTVSAKAQGQGTTILSPLAPWGCNIFSVRLSTSREEDARHWTKPFSFRIFSGEREVSSGEAGGGNLMDLSWDAVAQVTAHIARVRALPPVPALP